MKVFERILYDELLARTQEKIDPRQHGFLKNKSCNTNLLTFTESIARSLHEIIGTDVIYFDFAKAFDTVSHDLILQKLKVQYKIDGTLLKLFVNYLQGRKQQVIIDNAVSNSIDVLSGVPQGSILGPLFFVLFNNGMRILKLTLILPYMLMTQKLGVKLTQIMIVISCRKILIPCTRGLKIAKWHFIQINVKLYLYTTLDLISLKYFHSLNKITC